MTTTKRKLLEQVYDKLYSEAEAILNEFNPCGHKVAKGVHSCIGQAAPHNSTPQCCCEGCPMWDKGCKAEKPLTCKTWLCGIARLKHPAIAAKLDILVNKTCNFNFYICRGDKSASMKQAISRKSLPNIRVLRKELTISNL